MSVTPVVPLRVPLRIGGRLGEHALAGEHVRKEDGEEKKRKATLIIHTPYNFK